MKKILLLGSGELGKELTIALQRYGQYVVAVDKYENAPAMQVANESAVINMLDPEALSNLVSRTKPDLIVPEIEAIRTEKLFEFENQGIQVVPSAKATQFTMDRKRIRDLAARDLGLRTAPYHYAQSPEEVEQAVKRLGIPAVIKPLMSSSGKGQSIIHNLEEAEAAWNIAQRDGRGDRVEVIVEGFIDFDYEITLLTVTQKEGPTLFCPPIGHRQEGGDYQESWQPQAMNEKALKEAQQMAEKVTRALGGAGLWGVEFFVSKNGVYFSELSPRPHDTGMVTLAGTQNLNEFELHARAILGWPIPEITQERFGANAVILSPISEEVKPIYQGMEKAVAEPRSDLRIFGKPLCRKGRRMGIALSYGPLDSDLIALRRKAQRWADQIIIRGESNI